MKEFLKKNMLAVLSVLSIIFLALPMVTSTVSADFLGNYSASVSGFGSLEESFWGYVLLIGPILLIAMNYIRQLSPYKKAISLIIPILCIAALLLIALTASSWGFSGGGAEFKIVPSIGFYLLLLTYLGTMVAGAVVYRGLTLDKHGIEKMKAELSSAKNSVADTISRVSENAKDASDSAGDASPGRPAKARVNLGRADEILTLIERLYGMKDAGILTDEEFQSKKTELLKEL